MIDLLTRTLQEFYGWPVWRLFALVIPGPPDSRDIFGLAEFLASLALFLVVVTVSDFRYSYRLGVTRTDLRKLGFWLAFGVGAAILITDVWFENRLPLPRLLSNSNNLKLAYGFVFLVYVFRTIFVATISHVRFSSSNAKEFFQTNYHLIHQGNSDRLQIIAEESRRALPAIAKFAALVPNFDLLTKATAEKQRDTHEYARNFLLLIADTRFCKVVVDRVPAFAFVCFVEAQKYSDYRLPIFQFARNIGQEFIRNTDSSFYQEDSGYYSGLPGYAKPVTKIIFGDYRFIEKCASSGASPLETNYREVCNFTETQMKGYARAALAFLESSLKVTKGRSWPHSYALARMLESIQAPLIGLDEINDLKHFSDVPAYRRLNAIVDFIKNSIDLVSKIAERPTTFRISDPLHADIFDDISHLIFEVILAAASVTSPRWTAWSVQHNAVWSDIFGLRHSWADKIIALKVRRLIYNEIKEMDRFPNFKGARVLGYCLHVLGLTLRNRRSGLQREFFFLQAATLEWTKANYKKLLVDHPQVAKACLQGSISYDRVGHRLVQTYENATEKAPDRVYLILK